MARFHSLLPDVTPHREASARRSQKSCPHAIINAQSFNGRVSALAWVVSILVGTNLPVLMFQIDVNLNQGRTCHGLSPCFTALLHFTRAMLAEVSCKTAMRRSLWRLCFAWVTAWYLKEARSRQAKTDFAFHQNFNQQKVNTASYHSVDQQVKK